MTYHVWFTGLSSKSGHQAFNHIPMLKDTIKARPMTMWTHLIKIEEEEEDGLYIAESACAPNCLVWGASANEARAKMVSTIQSFQKVLLTGEPHGEFHIVEIDIPEHSPRPIRFVAHLTPDEIEGFIINCPMLPGCVSQGDTEDEALEMIRDAIDCYLDQSGLVGANAVTFSNHLVDIESSD